MISDILLKLLEHLNKKIKKKSKDILDKIFIFYTTLVEIMNNFKNKLKKVYQTNN